MASEEEDEEEIDPSAPEGSAEGSISSSDGAEGVVVEVNGPIFSTEELTR